MTKKLEEEFNLPPLEEVTKTEIEEVPSVEETQEPCMHALFLGGLHCQQNLVPCP